MNILSQYEISRRIKHAYQSVLGLALFLIWLFVFDLLTKDVESWMLLPVFYNLIMLGCAYGLYKRRLIAGVFLCCTLPIFYFVFMRPTVPVAVTMILVLYVVANGTYAIYQFNQRAI